jgi:hypothetical protein
MPTKGRGFKWEPIDGLGEHITNAAFAYATRLRASYGGYMLGTRSGDDHLVKGVSVVHETLIFFSCCSLLIHSILTHTLSYLTETVARTVSR